MNFLPGTKASRESDLLLGNVNNKRDYIILTAWTCGYTRRWRRSLRNITLVLMYILSNLTGNVTFPLLSKRFKAIGSDSFVFIFYTVVIASILIFILVIFSKRFVDKTISLTLASSAKMVLANALASVFSFILIVYASPPSRTPPYLQSILFVTVIPLTVVCRVFLLRKGVSFGRGICCCVVVVGLFISSEPQIWGLNTQQKGFNTSGSPTERISWPLCYTLGLFPFVLVNVTCEKELVKKNSDALNFIMWSQSAQIIMMTTLLWTDFIPGFGMTSNVSEFKEHAKQGIICLYSVHVNCRSTLVRSWIFISAFTIGTISQYLLIQSSDGAIFVAIVQAVASPLATLFWTLFDYNEAEDSIRWNPVFNEMTAFCLCGLALMFPGVILYKNFTSQEEKSEQENLLDMLK
ncbi:uncharacterized protein LOC133196821 [Saccostrea echinata]|uniref:uncharacterized protein LOC133196821 n=1 Tax=Saccostrea echinata TaxID=191078 RepID=UPI002A835DD5|nr:uncharacterized protein LOC133196821 [Saccostrea echinata]